MPTQQEVLYIAEDSIDQGPAFDTLDDIQRFVDELRDTAWWVRDYPMVRRVEVGPSDQRRNHGSVGWWDAERGAGRMEFGPMHRSLRVLLHELSHVLAEAKWGSKSHDPLFARTHCNLVYHVRGSAAWLELQAAYERYGIDYAK